MDRRRFLYQLTAASAASAAVSLDVASLPRRGSGQADVPQETHGGTPNKAGTRRVEYQVKGFTCITCAVGLEVMLRGLNGVTLANASYPANNVVIAFDEHVTGEKTLKEFITVCGFSVA